MFTSSVTAPILAPRRRAEDPFLGFEPRHRPSVASLGGGRLEGGGVGAENSAFCLGFS